MPLGRLAAEQLVAWGAIADGWEWELSEDGRVALCDCGRGIVLLFDEHGSRYRYTDDQWRALVVLHLRNFHPELDPDT